MKKCNDLEGDAVVCFKDLTWRDKGKPRTACDKTEIRTGYIPNTSL
jgi:hypothetical protein